jgi:hypothetical protein
MNGIKTWRYSGSCQLPKLRNEAGTTLLITVLALMIVALIGMIVARIASTEIEIAGHYRGANSSFYAADGAAEYGLNELLEIGRARGRFPTAAEMAAIPAPVLAGSNFTLFNLASAGPMVQAPIDTGFYQGLIAFTQPFRSAATAETAAPPMAEASVAMTANFDIIPIFQFAIFYEEDLEILPGPNMWLNGRVHSNQSIYIGCNNTLTVDSSMTAAMDIFNFRKNNGAAMPGTVQIRDSTGAFQAMAGLDSTDPNWETDALNRWDGNVRSQDHDVDRLNLTIEDPLNPIHIIESAEVTDDQGDVDAKMWYDADILILNGQAYDQMGNLLSTIDPVTATDSLRETVIFDQREQKDMLTVEVDMEKLGRSPAWPKTGGVPDPAIIWAGGDQPGGTFPAWPGAAGGVGPPEWAAYPTPWSSPNLAQFAVKMTNGDTLPAPATLVSDNPVYLQGNYNINNKVGSAVIADAITILSNRWGDIDGDGTFDDDRNYSTQVLNNRNAWSTTMNVALMTGNTDTNPGVIYNGGVENVLRFMERWSGDTLTYRGSIIDLWNSVIATGNWIYGSPIYTAPNRNWSFDTDFLDPANLPPGTPNVYTIRVIGWERQ